MANQKAIIYDDSCPLCCWYTGEFVKADLLEEKGRVSFNELSAKNLHSAIDMERSRDEIPLVDLAGGETLYGIDSLLFLLGSRFKWIPKIAAFAPINWFLRYFYKFISYNRRIIAASPKTTGTFDCTPHFNWFYRILFIVFAVGLGGGLIFSATILLAPHFAKLALLLVVMILFPAILISGKKGMEYAGLMATSLLLSGMVVFPGIIAPKILPIFFAISLVVLLFSVFKRLKLFFYSKTV